MCVSAHACILQAFKSEFSNCLRKWQHVKENRRLFRSKSFNTQMQRLKALEWSALAWAAVHARATIVVLAMVAVVIAVLCSHFAVSNHA